MISALLALLLWHATLSAPQRHEVCPGAIYFHSGHPPRAWLKGKREVCRIGRITFYTDKPRNK